MTGKKVGYIRVSTANQSVERQLTDLDLDIIFTDYASGKDTNRPKLQEMLNYIRDEDIIIVHSIDRLARNLDDLRKIIGIVTSKEARIKFIKEGLEFSGDKSPMSDLMLSMIGSIAEFEHSLIRERQMEGIAKAKARGVYKRANALTNEQITEIKQQIAQETPTMQVNKARLAKAYGISRTTLYTYLKD
jgi:DNA invertase Pin-like site-specific DNA recombinase